jgi:hypothetical protein
MPRFTLDLRLTPDEFLPYYRGEVQTVRARSVEGLVVEFPARLLQRFLTPEGICGRFVLTCDDAFRHARLERVGPPGVGGADSAGSDRV